MKPECGYFDRVMREPDGEWAEGFQAHLAECSACREEMELWRGISQAAPSLRQEWDSPGLWPRIRAELTGPANRIGAARAGWLRLAAGLLLTALSAAVLWISLSPVPESPGRAQRRNPLLTQQALEEVERAEAAYVQSIERLSDLVKPQLADNPTPLTINYREKLRLIDQAIQDIRASLEGNRFNAHARAELLAAYREKRDVLVQLMEEKGR